MLKRTADFNMVIVSSSLGPQATTARWLLSSLLSAFTAEFDRSLRVKREVEEEKNVGVYFYIRMDTLASAKEKVSLGWLVLSPVGLELSLDLTEGLRREQSFILFAAFKCFLWITAFTFGHNECSLSYSIISMYAQKCLLYGKPINTNTISKMLYFIQTSNLNWLFPALIKLYHKKPFIIHKMKDLML